MITFEMLIKIIKAIPKVEKLVEKSKPVFDAVKQVAPEVVPIIKDLAVQFVGKPEQSETQKQEIISKLIFAPHMTTEEETKWFNSQNDNG